ncbi:hypothetical protein BH18ACT4_BH18ACT4_02890 [soil metagenome]
MRAPQATLTVGVAQLLRRPGTQRELAIEAELEGLEVSSAAVPPGVPVAVDLVVESIPDAITATGTVQAPWVGSCRRCLARVAGTAVAAVREVFEHGAVEGETYPLEGDHLDLTAMVRDALLLSLPLAPLCDEACAGPDPDDYPVVVDSDVGAAEPAGRDPRWAVLDDLDLN